MLVHTQICGAWRRTHSAHAAFRAVPCASSCWRRPDADGDSTSVARRRAAVHAEPERNRQRAGQDVARGGDTTTSSRPTVGKLSELQYDEGEFVDLGYIKAAHGVRGELKVELLTDSPQERFGKVGKTMYLRPPQPKGVLSSTASSQLFELVTAGCRMQVVAEGREVCLLKFKEVGDRDIAEALRGYMIVLPSSLRKPLQAKDEHYVQDLVGCQVFLQSDGTYIGRVSDVISGFGTNDTLQLKLRPTKEDLDQSRVRVCMVPFAKEIVPLVDTHANRILVAPPEGLLDLATSKKAKKLDEQAKQEKLQEDEEHEREEKRRRANMSSGSSEPSSLNPEIDDVSDDEGSDKEEKGNESKAAAARRANRRRAAAGRKLRLRTPSS